MPRRIEIELTSRTAEGTWTWRAAGARQPKGTVGPDLVPSDAQVGGVYRAEIETGIEGIDIVGMLSAKTEKVAEKKAERIEVVGLPRTGPDVSVTLAPGSRRRRDGDERPRRREGGDRPRRGEGDERRGRPDGSGRRPTAGRRPASGRAGTDGDTGERRADGDGRRSAPGARRDRRPTVSTTHRNAMLAELGPEQLPVAEQLLRGGLPAVRQAIQEQSVRARAEGGLPANGDALLAMAEKLLPAVNLANWKDRATSAQAAGKELRLRELRAVVAASRTVILDDEGRTLAKALQDSLEHRVTALRDDWVARVGAAIDGGRMLDALHTASRPPEPSTRLPSELAVRIAQGVGAAMTAESEPAQWLALLEATVESPVRRIVKPTGIPAVPEVEAAARNAAGLVPELAKLLGLRIPPPPPRRAPTRPERLIPAAGGGRASAP